MEIKYDKLGTLGISQNQIPERKGNFDQGTKVGGQLALSLRSISRLVCFYTCVVRGHWFSQSYWILGKP
ncbi:hypothetical protein L3X38_021572 [Prunus dulcis]|uniref:Uncharacterized protein n=1 Tax=Prunus dulcis TaxID=3755 RepID=A0AAD4Z3K3_PRUDU|nr:hypothetical protein L3X38_021572 [Prunus dulcis]